jgi:hypothetical protein
MLPPAGKAIFRHGSVVDIRTTGMFKESMIALNCTIIISIFPSLSKSAAETLPGPVKVKPKTRSGQYKCGIINP